MSNQRILTSVAGKRKAVDSENEQVDFASIRVGADKLTLSELDVNTFTLNGKKVRTAAGTDDNDASTKKQLDDVEDALQTQITSIGGSVAGKVEKTGDSMSGDLTMTGGFTVKGIPLVPLAATDVASKSYVDQSISGQPPKVSCRVASASGEDVAGGFAGGVLTTVLTTLDLDGVTLVDGDRVLLKNQTNGEENGIYDVSGVGVAIIFTRSADADEDSEVNPGMSTFISEGTVNGDQGFSLTTDNPFILNTDPLTFTQTSGLGQVVAGNGLTKNGNVLDANVGAGVKIVADAIAADYDIQFTNGEAGAITQAQVVFVDPGTPTEVLLANADIINRDSILGLVNVASIASTVSGAIAMRRGAIVGGFAGLTVGQLVYVHNATLGSVTQDATTIESDNDLYSIGRAISTTQVLFDPQFSKRVSKLDFDIGVGGVVELNAGIDLILGQDIEVLVNGREIREGGSEDFTVDYALNKILFNTTIPENAWVRIKVV